MRRWALEPDHRLQLIVAVVAQRRIGASEGERASSAARIAPYGLVAFTAACGVAAASTVLAASRSLTVGLICLLISAAAVGGLLLGRYRQNGRFILEPPVLLVVVLFCWHFAFWPVYFLGIATDFRVRSYLEFAPYSTIAAFLTCTVAVLAVIAGTQAGMGTSRWRIGRIPPNVSVAVYVTGGVGTILVIGYFVLSGRGLVGQYSEFFTEEDPLRRLYNLGLVLVLGATAPVLISEESAAKRKAFLGAILLPTVIVSASLGSRYLLFSVALLALAARTMRGRGTKFLRLLLIAVLLVAVGATVKSLRTGDVKAPADVPAVLFQSYSNPFIEFPEEIGQTFLPVAGTIEQTPTRADYLMGRSFAAAAIAVIPGVGALTGYDFARPGEELAAEYDPERYYTQGGTFGYSLVAEFYLNGGMLAVLLGMTGFGYVFGRSYRAAMETRSAASFFMVWAVVAFAMFGVRNDAFTWIRYAIYSAVIFWLLGRSMDAVRKRRRLADRDSGRPLQLEPGHSTRP